MRSLWSTVGVVLWASACVVPYYDPDAETDQADSDDTEDTVAADDTDAAPPDDTEDPPRDDTDAPDDTEETEDTTPEPTGDPSPAHDTCADAVAGRPIQAGFYEGSLAGFGGDGLDPACIRFASGGADAYAKVTLQNGQAMVATFDPAGGDAQMYLLADCSNDATCIAGADDYTAQAETLSFANSSGGPQTAYLVIAMYGVNDPAGAYTLNVQIQ